MEPSELQFIDARLTRLEDISAKQQEATIVLVGQHKIMEQKVDDLCESVSSIGKAIDGLGSKSGQTNLLQKGLIGAIVVQALLNGLATPETAKHILAQLFGGGILK